MSARCAGQLHIKGLTGVGMQNMDADQDVLIGSSGLFLRRTYREAIDLLWRARLYVSEIAATEVAQLPPGDRLAHALETVRLTARLTHMMAWLLLQRAAEDGEMPPADATKEAPELEKVEVCLAGPPVDRERLPTMLLQLLDESDQLYRRLARLDSQARTPKVTLPVALSALTASSLAQAQLTGSAAVGSSAG